MDVLLLNGSPRRNGNTDYAVKKMAEGITKNSSNTLEVINIINFTVGGCFACDGCRHNGGNCVIKDDTKHIIDKVSSADVIIFATPVYWWGMSSQLKAVIDKFYSAELRLATQKKQIGVVSIGASAINDKQYSLISDQFSCICDFLGWKKIFNLPFSASDCSDLQKSKDATHQLVSIWEKFN